MKKLSIYFVIINVLLIIFSPLYTTAQVQYDSTRVYVVTKHDGHELTGKIKRSDAKEILIFTQNLGDVIVPKHLIKEIRLAKFTELDMFGEYQSPDIFATRYFSFNNALSLPKGEHFVQWNLFGPDFQFGITDNFDVGIVTTWLAAPILANVKYTLPIMNEVNLGVGAYVGSFSWIYIDAFILAPYGVLTLGDQNGNVSLTGGYLYMGANGGNSVGTPMYSASFMSGLGKKLDFVFESIVLPGPSDNPSLVAYLTPGLRWQLRKSSLQFGFGIVFNDEEILPYPIPMFQWFAKI